MVPRRLAHRRRGEKCAPQTFSSPCVAEASSVMEMEEVLAKMKESGWSRASRATRASFFGSTFSTMPLIRPGRRGAFPGSSPSGCGRSGRVPRPRERCPFGRGGRAPRRRRPGRALRPQPRRRRPVPGSRTGLRAGLCRRPSCPHRRSPECAPLHVSGAREVFGVQD